jgi:hypothetical protein
MSYPHRRHSRQNYVSHNRRKDSGFEAEPAIFDIIEAKDAIKRARHYRKMLRELLRELSDSTLDELLCPELRGDAPNDKP